MCEIVPNRWNNIAVNWMTKINAKKNTNTKPIGSNCKYSFDMCTYLRTTEIGEGNNKVVLKNIIEETLNK